MAEGEEESLVTVSGRLAYHKKRGKKLFERAEALLIKGSDGASRLASFLKYDDCASFFYRSSISFRASGRYRESADALVRCATMYEKLKLFLEAATLFTEAAEIFAKVDKAECVRCMRRAISIYCDAGKFDIAARMERKVAHMHFHSKHWEDAAFHFKKASNFLAGEQLLDQADDCLEYTYKCFQEIGEIEKVRSTLVTLATNCLEQNLRRFNAKGYLFDALLTLIAEPLHYKFDDVTELLLKPGVKQTDIVTVDDVVQRHSLEKYKSILQQSRDYEMLDPYFRVSKECLFIDNIVKHRLNFDLHATIDHIYYWNNVRPLGEFQLKYLHVLVDEIETEQHRRLELRSLAQMRKDQAAARRKKRIELREQMLELGLDAAIMTETIEKMMITDEAAVEAAKTPLTLVWEAHFTSRKKELRRRAKMETDEHMSEFPEEGEEGEEAQEGEETHEGGEEEPDEKKEGEFSDAEISESEDDEPKEKKGKEKKERKKRAVNPNKVIL